MNRNCALIGETPSESDTSQRSSDDEDENEAEDDSTDNDEEQDHDDVETSQRDSDHERTDKDDAEDDNTVNDDDLDHDNVNIQKANPSVADMTHTQPCDTCVVCSLPDPSYLLATPQEDLDYIQRQEITGLPGARRRYTGISHAYV